MAKIIDRIIVVLVLFFYLITGSNSQFGPVCSDPNQQLMNTVVYEGSSSSFNQVGMTGITWKIAPSFDPNGSPTPPYLIADEGVTPYPGVYAVTPTQLSIHNASIYNQSSDPYSTSGLYTVTYKDDCESMANLIVVSRGPECQCNPIDEDNAQLTCLVEMGVTRVLPNYATMTWTTNSGNQVSYDEPEPNHDQPNYDISASAYQVSSSGAASYSCTVKFKAPDPVYQSMATNAPTFTASCTVANCVKTTATTTGPGSTTTAQTSKPPPCNCYDPNKQLMNVVVYEGNSSSFFNQFDPSNVKWEVYPSYDPTASPSYLVADDGVTPYTDVYTVTSTQLLIPTASTYPRLSDPYSTSGLYTVTYKTDGSKAMANLIVVSRGPACLCCMIDQDNAQLSCELQYGVTRILPNHVTMTWTTDSGNQAYYDQPTPNQSQPNYDISVSRYQITSSGAASYTCEVGFKEPDAVFPNMASNVPTFRASCTVANCVIKTTTTTVGTKSTTNTPTTHTQWPVCSDPNQQLMNTVVYEGSSASFNQAQTTGMTWKIAPSYDPNGRPTPPYLIIDHGNNFYPDVYVDNPTQLDIPRASIYPQGSDPYSSSGLYVANYDDDGCESRANLIVVSRGPECQCNLIDGDNAQLTCLVEMGASRVVPNNATMTWTTDSGNEVYYEEPTPNIDQPNYDTSVSAYQVTSSGAASYTCTVKFKAPDPVFPSMATNAPSFTATCTVANCVKTAATTTIGP